MSDPTFQVSGIRPKRYLFSESQRYSLANALRVAAVQFEQDAQNVDHSERIRDQFARQANEAETVAEALMNMIGLTADGMEASEVLATLNEREQP